MEPPVVRAASESDRRRICDLLTLAFVTDPLARWAIPHPTRYLEAFPGFVDAFGGPGLVHGASSVADELRGPRCGCHPGSNRTTSA